MLSEKVDEIFKRFKRNNPYPKIELNYSNDFTLLVAIVLSARTTDISVNIVTKELFKIVDSADKMIKLGEENLKKYINKIGLYNVKARNILKLSKILVQDYDNSVPKDFSILIKLPGVGRKSANVFLNSAYGMPLIGIDTHILRLSNRLELVVSTNLLFIEEKMLSMIPEKYLNFAHQWMVLHGRYICKALKPLCHKCFLTDVCPYFFEKIKSC